MPSRADIVRVFVSAVDNGSLPIATLETVVARFNITSSDVLDDEYALERYCSTTPLDTLKWFVQRFPPTHTCALNGFVAACDAGRLDIMQWLDANFHFTKDEVREDAMRLAFGVGNVHIADWFATRFRVRKADVLGEIFVRSCLLGNVSVVRWFVVRFRLTDREVDDACTGHCDTVRAAVWITRGCPPATIDRFDIVHAFAESASRMTPIAELDAMATRLQITPDEVCVLHGALDSACEEGRLDAVQWLVDRFAPPVEIALRGFETACANDRLDVAQFLDARFHFTPKDAEMHALAIECAIGGSRLADWVADRFLLRKRHFTDRHVDFVIRDVASTKWLLTRFRFNAHEIEQINASLSDNTERAFLWFACNV